MKSYWYEVLTLGMVVSCRVQRKRRIVTSSTMSWAGLYLQLELLHGWDWLSLQCHHHLPLHPSDRSCAGMDFSIDLYHIYFSHSLPSSSGGQRFFFSFSQYLHIIVVQMGVERTK